MLRWLVYSNINKNGHINIHVLPHLVCFDFSFSVDGGGILWSPSDWLVVDMPLIDG